MEDVRKLGCSNWLTAAQDRGHWRHMLEEAKACQSCKADDDDYDNDDDEEVLFKTSSSQSGHTVVQLVEALCYKSEGHGFNSLMVTGISH